MVEAGLDLARMAERFARFDLSSFEDATLPPNVKLDVSCKLSNDLYLASGQRSKIDIKFKFSDRSVDNKIFVDDALSFRGTINVNGSNNIVFISDSDQKLTCTIDVRGQDNNLFIGRNTSINQANLLVDGDGSRLTIGDECMLSYGIRVRTSDSHAIIDLKKRQQINHSQDVVIGPRVWIASNVMVLKGTTIGEGSIIAAASVVTKSVPAVSLAAGIPARVIRKNVSWSRASLPKQAEIDRIADHFEAEGLLDELD